MHQRDQRMGRRSKLPPRPASRRRPARRSRSARPFGTSASCALAAARVRRVRMREAFAEIEHLAAASRARAAPRSCACHRHSRRSAYRDRPAPRRRSRLSPQAAPRTRRAHSATRRRSRGSPKSRAASRPSLPAFTAAANWSNTQRVRNSVVVLTPLNSGDVVEVPVVERLQRRLQHVDGAADVDHDAVGVELLGHERDRDREGRAVQRLRGAEHLAPERMGDHDVVGTSTAYTGAPSQDSG